MKKETRENKFKCPLGGYVDGNNGCPIYRRMMNAEGGKND